MARRSPTTRGCARYSHRARTRDRQAIVLLCRTGPAQGSENRPDCPPLSWSVRWRCLVAARCASSRIARAPRPNAAWITMRRQYRHPREYAVHLGEEANGPGAGQGDGGARRFLCPRRFLRGAPRSRLDPGRGDRTPLPSFAGRAMEASSKPLKKHWIIRSASCGPGRRGQGIVKLAVLGHLLAKVDHLIIGGGMGPNNFLAARGVAVGKSLCEHDLPVKRSRFFAPRGVSGAQSICPTMSLWPTEFAANPPSFAHLQRHETRT